MYSIARTSWLACLLLTLAAGCGGGGGGGTPPTPCPTIGVCTGFVGDLNWEISGLGGGLGGTGGDGSGPGDGGDGGGGAAAGGDFGQFRRALVIAKFPDGSLVGNGSALTDDSGLVTVRPGKTYGGPLLLELHGQPDAVYYDEGKNTFIPFPPGRVLRAYIPTVNSNMAITPFSEAAYRLLVEGDTAERVTGVPKRAQVEAANNKVRDIVNSQFPSSVQIADLTRLPILKSDTTLSGTIGIDVRGAHSLITGAFSKQASMFNPAEPAPTLAATDQLSEDLLDGHLDGMRSGRSTIAANKRTYDAHSLAGELSSALAQQSYRFGTNTAVDAMPAVTNFGNTRYETYLFDAKLTPSGKAIVTVAGWDGANDKNRNTGDARPLLPDTARIQSVHGNLGHGSLFLKADSDNSISKLYAVGDNTNGELGNGTREVSTSAVEVSLPGTMTHIAGGFGHTVARTADGSVYAWGDNSYGQLGQGLPSAQLVRSVLPLKVTLPRGAIAVAASNSASYALLDDGSVYSWGSSWGLGLLGDGTKDSVRTSPAAVLSGSGALTGVVQIAARDNDAVVLRSDGSVMTWGSFPADQSGGFTGGRQVATLVSGLPDPGTVRIRKILTEQGLFVAQTTTGAVYHWGLHFDITAQTILRDVTAVQVLNLPPVRDIMPGGFLGYGERPFDRVTAMGADPNGGLWKIRGRVAEFFDPANPTAQRRPKTQSPRADCASCHNVLPTWPIKAPTPTINTVCVLPSFKLDASGRPILVTSASECTMCHNNSPLPFLNCVIPTLPAPSAPSIPPITTNACQIPTAHVATPSGTVCASCHNSIIAQPLKCLPNTASDPLAPTTRVAITAVTDDAIPVTGNIALGGTTNDPTPTITGSIGASSVAGQSTQVQVLRNGTVISTLTITGATWSLTDTTQPPGTYTYTARVVQDGRFGPLSPNYTIIIDTVLPTATIQTLNILDNAGPVNGVIAAGASTDDSTPQIQGSLSAPLGAGESVRIIRGGTDIGGATVVGTTFDFSNPTLTNGAYTFNVRVVDAAGNIGSNLTRAIVVDINSTLGATATASISNALDDFGTIQLSLSNNSVSDDATPTLRGTIGRALIPANGEQVRVYRTGSTAVTTATVSGTTWSFTPTLTDGAYTFTAQIVDNQGRAGSISNSFTIRIDRTAPGTSVAVSGVSDYPPQSGGISGIVNENTPRITISLGAPRAADESFVITRSLGGAAAVALNASIGTTSTSPTPSTFFFDDIVTSLFRDVSSPTPVNPPSSGPRYTGPPAPDPFSALSVLYAVRLSDAAGNQGPPSNFSFTLNYPSCAGRQPANHTASTDCAACHRTGNGFVMVPPGSTPRYWCRN